MKAQIKMLDSQREQLTQVLKQRENTFQKTLAEEQELKKTIF